MVAKVHKVQPVCQALRALMALRALQAVLVSHVANLEDQFAKKDVDRFAKIHIRNIINPV